MKKLLNIALVLSVLMLLAFSCDKDVSVTPPESEPQNGKLKVNTEPDGFTIFIDGLNQGKETPDSIIWLDQKDYMVTLKRKLWMDTSFVVSLVDTEVKTKDISFDAPRFKGSIRCTSLPDSAEIYLNGNTINQLTPYTIRDLYPGNYEVTFKLPEHRANINKVDVKSSMQSFVYNSLTDTSIWLDYNYKNSDLTSNYVYNLAISSNDVKWVNTGDKGLVRFNDKDWKIFTDKNSGLPTTSITKMEIDNNDNLWILSSYGLVKYDGFSWILFSEENSDLPSNTLLDLEVLENNDVWVATNKGIVKYSSGNWTIYNKENSNFENEIFTEVMAYEDKILAGTAGNGLEYYDGSEWHHFDKYNKGLPGNTISSIGVSSDGIFYVGHWPNLNKGEKGGMTIFENNSFNKINLSVPSVEINEIFTDKDNNVWICTKSGLEVFKQNGNREFFIVEKLNMPGDNIKDMVQDSNGDYWLSIYENGLVKFKYKNVKN